MASATRSAPTRSPRRRATASRCRNSSISPTREQVVGVISFDERVLPKPVAEPDEAPELFHTNGESKPIGPYLVAVSEEGQSVRLLAESYAEPSTRNGRLFMRLVGKDQVVAADVAAGDENVCLASKSGYVLIFPVLQISLFKSAAKGVVAMRLGSGDRVLGATLSNAARDGLEVETSRAAAKSSAGPSSRFPTGATKGGRSSSAAASPASPWSRPRSG